MNWHQMIPAWFRRAKGGNVAPRQHADDVPALLSTGRHVPTIVVLSPIYRHAHLYTQWKREQPETDPLTIFRLISNPDRLRGMRGDGIEFVYVEAPGSGDPFIADQLTNYVGIARRCHDGSMAPLTFVNLDRIYGVYRDGQ